MKICKTCNIEKPDSEFYKYKTPPRLYPYCKSCTKEKRTEYSKTEHAKSVKKARVDSGAEKRAREKRLKNQETYKRMLERSMEYAKSEKGRERGRRYYRENKHKYDARHAVRTEIRAGRLTVPDECQEAACHNTGPLQAHHCSYEKEHWLDIEWLCEACHLNRHGKRKRILSLPVPTREDPNTKIIP